MGNGLTYSRYMSEYSRHIDLVVRLGYIRNIPGICLNIVCVSECFGSKTIKSNNQSREHKVMSHRGKSMNSLEILIFALLHKGIENIHLVRQCRMKTDSLTFRSALNSWFHCSSACKIEKVHNSSEVYEHEKSNKNQLRGGYK